jgi:hypothetical protein
MCLHGQSDCLVPRLLTTVEGRLPTCRGKGNIPDSHVAHITFALNLTPRPYGQAIQAPKVHTTRRASSIVDHSRPGFPSFLIRQYCPGLSRRIHLIESWRNGTAYSASISAVTPWYPGNSPDVTCPVHLVSEVKSQVSG